MTKPHLHPVHAPNGRLLTRVSPPDHEWHRAVWFAIKYVNGENFWEESPHEPHGDQFDMGDGKIEWRRSSGEVVVVEHRDITRVDLGLDAVAEGERAYAIDWTTALTPTVDVALDRTPYTTWGGYGGLTLRGAGDWEETRILVADGSVHRRPEAVPSVWCDLSSADAGITFLDHPDNVRHPVAWYGATRSRVYGTDGWSNYLNAAFLFHRALTLPAGETLMLRYRLVVHDGMWSVERCNQAWRSWIDG